MIDISKTSRGSREAEIVMIQPTETQKDYRRGTVTIKAIHDADLVKVLKKLRLYEGVVKGEYKCYVCGRRITLENIGGLFKSRDGKINFVCNNMKCLITVAEMKSRINKE